MRLTQPGSRPSGRTPSKASPRDRAGAQGRPDGSPRHRDGKGSTPKRQAHPPRPIDRKAVERLVKAEGFTLAEDALEGLAAYLESLVRWNRAMNLVGPSSWQEVLRTLAVDSLHLARFLATLPLPPEPLTYDLGAGAGLPGIVLRLVWQDGTYWMVESKEKRSIFLEDAVMRLPLGKTHVRRDRAEDFLADRPPADILLGRAFLPWREFLSLAHPHLAPGGIAIVMANSPPPAPLPVPWRLEGQHPYKTRPGPRWLWALAPEAAP
jgi:16S rRNA (guanine527-N7)-methyltransferase